MRKDGCEYCGAIDGAHDKTCPKACFRWNLIQLALNQYVGIRFDVEQLEGDDQMRKDGCEHCDVTDGAHDKTCPKACPFVPILDQVIVIQDEAPDKVGRLWLPDQSKQRPWRGKVVALGPGLRIKSVVDEILNALDSTDKAKVIEQLKEKAPHLLEKDRLAIGDIVYFAKWHGCQYEHNGVTYMFLCENEVLGRLVHEPK